VGDFELVKLAEVLDVPIQELLPEKPSKRKPTSD